MTLALLAAGIENFFEAVSWFLGWLFKITNSYGAAIILLTLVVMIVTAPLTLKSTRSMLQMQRHQPELKKLQAQYKDDRERLNQELMAFYKDNGINPLSGCIPVLMQMPIFILLYQILRGVTQRMGGSASGIGRVAGNLVTSQPFKPWKLHEQVFQPIHLSKTTEMYRALTSTTKMSFFGVDLSISPLDATRIGLITAIPFLVLIALMLGSQIIQNRQIQGRSRGNVNPQQQAIMKIVPFMLPIFSFNFPAGLGLYYFVQGLCRIGLQGYITKAVYEPHHAEMDAKESTPNAPAKDKAGAGAISGGGAISNGSAGTKAKPKPAAESTPPKSPKSQAAQRKAGGGGSAQVGRKSGDPRSGRSNPGSSGKN